ncbi:MAG: hypothetical protein ACD_52C00320G0008 [uncultured bacterium]|nr:MAG: hypothetical protein ACD_52C00320G0008 [uncultured bacterium]
MFQSSRTVEQRMKRMKNGNIETGSMTVEGGRFLVLEGNSGVGKTTQSDRLAKFLDMK